MVCQPRWVSAEVKVLWNAQFLVSVSFRECKVDSRGRTCWQSNSESTVTIRKQRIHMPLSPACLHDVKHNQLGFPPQRLHHATDSSIESVKHSVSSRSTQINIRPAHNRYRPTSDAKRSFGVATAPAAACIRPPSRPSNDEQRFEDIATPGRAPTPDLRTRSQRLPARNHSRSL